MNAEYYADEIISILNKGLDADELRVRLTKVINRIFEQERTKHLTKGTEQYKRIDAENPIRVMPKRDVENAGYKPTLADFTNEARFTPEERIGED